MVLSEEYIRKIILQEISNAISANPTEYDLSMSFDKINNSFFNGCLPKCQFNLQLDKDYMGLFKYDGINAENETLINPIISVNGAYQYNTLQLDSIMAHEMIHYYLAYAYIDMQCTHGEAFQHMANEMNSELGLNIEEEVDTGNIQYKQSEENMFEPSKELLAYMQSYMNSFAKYAAQMKKGLNDNSIINATQNNYVVLFIQNLLTYTNAMVNALQRCVNSQSINEANGSTMNGTQLVNDFKRGFRKGYRFTKELLYQIFSFKRGAKTKNATYDSNGNLKTNKNITLVELLYSVFPTIEKNYEDINSQSENALNKFAYVTNVMTCSKELRDRIDAEINEFNNGQNNDNNVENAQEQ